MTEPTADLGELWPSIVTYLTDTDRALAEHREPLTKTAQRFLELVKPVMLAQGYAIFSVANEGTRDYVESHLTQPIAHALSDVLQKPTVVAISIVPEELPEPEEESSPALFNGWSTAHTKHSQPQHKPVQTHTEESQPQQSQMPRSHHTDPQPPTDYASTNLSRRYTLANFVVGSSNRFASSAAASVAENPAKAYNPLFIYGGSGLGKTHLLQATGNYALQLFPQLKVCYISTESFVSGFIDALRFQRIDAFKQRYRALDMLIIDDIQFLQGRESTQEEFFHTFNTLYESGSQIVLSSDRRPEELTILEDRLRTRFQGGLITDVQPPDMESRIAILNKLAEADGLDIPQDVIELVASRFDSSVRELNGAYKRVTAQASITHEPFTCDLALQAIEALGGGKATVTITTDLIMDTVAEYFNISTADIMGTKKSQPIAHARQIAMYLSRDLTDLSFPDIGKAFGGKHHSTVVHAHQKIGKDINNKETVYNDIQELTRLIKQA